MTLEIIILVLGIIKLASKCKKSKELVDNLKKQIMWSSVFRGQIQFYFPVAVAILSQLKDVDFGFGTIQSLFKLVLLLLLPGFSYVYLRLNYRKLEEPDFQQKFGTLYQNLYPLKRTVYKMTSIFCLKRLIYALVTVYLTNYVVPFIYIYTMIPLAALGFNLNRRPMNSTLLNLMENINEVIIYICGYFLLIFT